MAHTLAIAPGVRKSPFFEATVAAGATRFTVYNHMYLPLSYGDPQGEYWRLIKDVAMWDVAAERQVEIAGADAAALAQYLSPRDLSRCRIGQGKYVPLCDHAGRLINDPVLLRLAEDRFWLSIADSDVLLWARAVAAERGYNVAVREPDVSPLAIQGPKAEALVCDLFGDWVRELKYFWFRETALKGIPLVVARSGWSKQGGFELYLMDGSRGRELWHLVREAGQPYGIGPGAPNAIERIESGLVSYGSDTDAESTPFELGLERYLELDIEADFIGKTALREMARRGPARCRVGLFLEGPPLEGIAHPWTVAWDGRAVGKVTAAAYSPRLNSNIALARLERGAAEAGGELLVDVPEGSRSAYITKVPFL